MSNDTALKEQKAQEYFENCDYLKASPLFKDLIESYSSSAKVEKVYFYYSYCDYLLEDYLLAAYEFQKILKKFPRGKYAEQAQFLLADCFYHSTPKYNLDQDYNLRATEEFQLFLDRFPKSPKREEANKKIDELYTKREKKAFEAALLYHRMENYRSSMSALTQLLFDFPDIAEAEKIRYLIVEASYKYAEKSVEVKKIERYAAVNNYAKKYFKYYSSSEKGKYYPEVIALQEKAKDNAEQLKEELPFYYLKKKRYDLAVELLQSNLRSGSTQEKRGVYADQLLEAHFRKGIGSEDRLKAGAVDTFLQAYNSNASLLLESDQRKWDKKVQYLEALQSEMYREIPYNLEAAGEYQQSTIFFEKWMDTIDLSNDSNHEHFYFYLKTKHKAARKSLEVEAQQAWQELLERTQQNKGWESGDYSEKIGQLVDEVNEELERFPIELIAAPLDRKDYALAFNRAVQVDQKKDLQNKEDVVYLLLLSSVKKAKDVSKYERLPLYEQARSLIEQRRGELSNPKLIKKTERLYKKALRKIKKYENN